LNAEEAGYFSSTRPLGKPEEIITILEQKSYLISKLGSIYGEMTFENFKKLRSINQ